MHTYKRAFTLIELLIAILIIGLLTAIALPMYQKSVDKSRYATLMPLAKSIHEAQEAFYLGGGKYSKDLGSLDVRVPGNPSGNTATLSDGTTLEISNTDETGYVKMGKENLHNYYVMYQNRSANYPGEIHCEALTDHARANELCQNLGGTPISGSLTEGYTAYILSGTGAGTPSTPGTPDSGEDPTNELTPLDCALSADPSACADYTDTNRLTLNDQTCLAASDGYIEIDFGTETEEIRQQDACNYGTYQNASVCIGKGFNSCVVGSFTNSSCIGNGTASCMGGTYTNSSCLGNEEEACSHNKFTNNSRCYANASYACFVDDLIYADDAQDGYDATSCCIGTYCQSGTTCAEKGLPENPS